MTSNTDNDVPISPQAEDEVKRNESDSIVVESADEARHDSDSIVSKANDEADVTVQKVNKGKNRDLTSGSIFGAFLLMAFPLALINILQAAFSAADQIVVGQFSGEKSLAAVGACGSVVSMIVSLFTGVAQGANIVMAHAIGARRKDKAERITHCAIPLSFIFGCVIMLLGEAALPLIIKLSNVTDPEVIVRAEQYLRILFICYPFSMVYNFAAALLRADGDTRHSLYFLTFAGVLNVALNYLTVGVFNMDVAGVALATLASNMVSCVLIVGFMMRSKGVCRFEFKKMRFFKKEIFEISAIGVPVGLYTIISAVSNIVMQSCINGLGSAASAGYSTSCNYGTFTATAISACFATSTTFISQNYGARKFKRMYKAVRESLLAMATVWFVFCAVQLAIMEPASWAYCADSTAARAYFIERTVIYLPAVILQGTNEIFMGGLRSVGYSIVPTIVSGVGIGGVRIGLILATFPFYQSISSILVCVIISWAVMIAINATLFIVLSLKRRNRYMRETAAREQAVSSAA